MNLDVSVEKVVGDFKLKTGFTLNSGRCGVELENKKTMDHAHDNQHCNNRIQS